VKLAEDRSGDVIVRLYEAAGGRASATVTTGFPVTSATETDLLERPLADSPTYEPTEQGSLEVTLRPFQLLTLRLARG
jgi:alpha-mannosidase